MEISKIEWVCEILGMYIMGFVSSWGIQKCYNENKPKK